MTDIEYREGDTPEAPDEGALAVFYQEHKDDPTVWEDAPAPPAIFPGNDSIDAWGISRDEWANRPSLEVAHGAPRYDDNDLGWYDCRECDSSYASLSGLLMHRNRAHVSEAMKAERFDKMSKAHKESAARRKAEKKEAATYVGEDPEVQEILAKTRLRGTPEYDARRKRWAAAQKKGLTEGQFAAKELDRAIALVTDPSIASVPANKGKKATKMAAPTNAATQADDLFERIGRATDILFPNGVTGAHILQIAELQKDMLALMQGLA